MTLTGEAWRMLEVFGKGLPVLEGAIHVNAMEVAQIEGRNV
jgi:hypothetical protein